MTIPFQDNDFDVITVNNNIKDETTKNINEKDEWPNDDNNNNNRDQQNINKKKENSFEMIIESVITKGKRMFTKNASFESIKYSIQVVDDNECYSFDGSFNLYDFTMESNFNDYSSYNLDKDESIINDQSNNLSNQLESDENEEPNNLRKIFLDTFNSVLRIYNRSKPF